VRALRILTSAIILAASSAVAAEPSQEMRRAVATVTDRLHLQTELPTEPEPASWHIDLPIELQWILLACGLALLAYLALPWLRDLRLLARFGAREGAWDAASGAGGAEADPRTEAVVSADELAENGLFVEAMHRLLLQSLAEIRLRSGEIFPDSFTSREILRRAKLPDGARRALGAIIAGVETTYFGDYPARYGDYESCRQRYLELTQAIGAA
jgi:hypothetical protein